VKLPGPYDEGPLTYLIDRGFEDKTLERWGVRYVIRDYIPGQKGEFRIEHSVAIPIRDPKGHLLAWCYRRTAQSPGWQPRYLYTHGAALADIWFGMQHHAQADEVVVVEGALDCMWLDQHGIPALGMLGSTPSERKIRWLRRYRSVTVLGDRDAAGVATAQRIGAVLGDQMPLRIARYPKWSHATDPAELNGLDLEIVIARAQPWAAWQMANRLS
jgi:DNA primase